MLKPEQVALILLAAGHSRRFDGDKLSAEFLDKPLAYHVVTALEKIPFCHRIAVVADTRLDFSALGYEVIENANRADGKVRSLCLGVTRAMEVGCDYVLVAMADMPRVTAAHILRLLDTANGFDTIVASSDGTQPGPPALFGRDHFDDLLDLASRRGVRELIRAGRHVVTTPAELVDIDTREDLEKLRKLYGLKTDGK